MRGHTIFVHVGGETFVEPTGPTLIPVRLVDRAAVLELTLSFASVHPGPMNAPLEETRTT